jgi:hypothetical protein
VLKLIPEWLWPRLDPPSSQQAIDQQRRLASLKEKVKQGVWTEQSDVALEEARRLFDAEQERRRGADSKAGIYLAAITALIPVLASLLPNLWGNEIGKAFAGLSLLVFVCALIYLLRAGLWAFGTIKISGFSQLGPSDIAESWNSKNPEEQLAKHLLQSVIFNFDRTNKKLSCIKMSHEYLLRAFFCFVAFLTIQAVWPISAWAVGVLYTDIITPLLMCFP